MAKRKTPTLQLQALPPTVAADEYSPADAAKYLGLSANYMAQMRFYEKGPKFRKSPNKRGGRVFYKIADLDAWNVERAAKKAARRNAPRKQPSRQMKKAA